jgi:hypothetical protein
MAAFKQFDTDAFFRNLESDPAATAASAANTPSKPKYAAVAASAAGVSGEKIEKEWDIQAWQSFYDKRAGFLEYDCNLTRNEAEQQAYEATIIQWLNVTALKNLDADHCAQCGNPVGEIGRDSVPFLTGGDGYAWLHHGCHTAWVTRRRQEAVETLKAIGIVS